MKLVEIRLKTKEKFTVEDAPYLRGYFGNSFRDNYLFHNHLSETSFKYDFPFIQYRVIDGEMSILGIEKGGDMLEEIVNLIKEIKIGKKIIEVEPILTVREEELEVTQEIHSYRFKTKWFALNDRNFKIYKKGEFDLNKQLRNNLLELFKMCGIWAESRIEVNGEFEEHNINKKENRFIVFSGKFQTNVKMPNEIAIGKRKSIGFGVIEKL